MRKIEILFSVDITQAKMLIKLLNKTPDLFSAHSFSVPKKSAAKVNYKYTTCFQEQYNRIFIYVKQKSQNK